MTIRRCLPTAALALALIAPAVSWDVVCAAGPTSGPTDSTRLRRSASDGPDSRAVGGEARRDPARSRKLPRGGNGGGWLQTLGALAVVVAVIFAVRMLLKRFAGSAPLARRAGAIEVLAQTRLAARQQLSLVRLGRRLVLLGSGPAGIRSLAEVTDPQEVEELLAAARSGATGALAGVLARQGARAAGGSDEKTHSESPSEGSKDTNP